MPWLSDDQDHVKHPPRLDKDHVVAGDMEFGCVICVATERLSGLERDL